MRVTKDNNNDNNTNGEEKREMSYTGAGFSLKTIGMNCTTALADVIKNATNSKWQCSSQNTQNIPTVSTHHRNYNAADVAVAAVAVVTLVHF